MEKKDGMPKTNLDQNRLECYNSIWICTFPLPLPFVNIWKYFACLFSFARLFVVVFISLEERWIKKKKKTTRETRELPSKICRDKMDGHE